ncbi:hypothetical protein SE336_16060 [Xanthomonas arboricola]|uniref:hypothetical protein n=1 Tax=Xanthomonas arboricola TaxID=56448 RepID=UPI0039F4CC44
MSTPLAVLAALDHEISVWAGRMSTPALLKNWPEAQARHAALMQQCFFVVELIEADRELDTAYAEFPPIGRGTPAQIDDAAGRVNAALHRRSAALSNVGAAA